MSVPGAFSNTERKKKYKYNEHGESWDKITMGNPNVVQKDGCLNFATYQI